MAERDIEREKPRVSDNMWERLRKIGILGESTRQNYRKSKWRKSAKPAFLCINVAVN